jgi:hypothetical protein
MKTTRRYPVNNRLHTKIRKANPGVLKASQQTASTYGATSRFTTRIPAIAGFNTGKVPANY